MTAEPDLRVLLMAWVDGELDPGDVARVEQAVAADPALARELTELRALKALTDRAALEERTAAELDAFWSSVYNRLERRMAAALLAAGALIVLVVASWLFFARPTTPLPIKIGVACAGAGALALLWSVWRERARVLPFDRYSREVNR